MARPADGPQLPASRAALLETPGDRTRSMPFAQCFRVPLRRKSPAAQDAVHLGLHLGATGTEGGPAGSPVAELANGNNLDAD